MFWLKESWFKLIAGLPLALLAAGCHFSPPPPSGSATDEIYKEQRQNRQSYTESSNINACSDSGCYVVPATIYHSFGDDGKESKYVEQIDFDNGGYLEFNVPIPGSGTDQKGNDWSFSY